MSPPFRLLPWAIVAFVGTTVDFPSQASRELGALRSVATPATWMRLHPTDTLEVFVRRDVAQDDDRWCARAIARALDGDAATMRYAYFYPPPVKPDLSLPPAEDSMLVSRSCALGAVWLENSGLGGRQRAEQTREALTRVYGPIRPEPDPRFAGDTLDLEIRGSGRWSAIGRWESDSMVMVSAYDGNSLNTPRVVAFAFLPLSGFGARHQRADASREYDRKTIELALRAARFSGIDSIRVQRLVRAFASAGNTSRGSTEEFEARASRVRGFVATVLNDWLQAARQLEPRRRAAALLAADQVLGTNSMEFVYGADSAGGIRQALAALGARFARNELGGGYTYTHSWLDQAQELDSAGPAGRWATLALLRRGLDKTGMCSGGENASEQVSALAEKLLGSGRDTADVAELHLLAAEGYADVVALAAGAGGEYSDQASFTTPVPVARRKAIEHYRQALRFGPAPVSGDAWLTAWRLLAGLPPTKTHFFCVYD